MWVWAQLPFGGPSNWRRTPSLQPQPLSPHPSSLFPHPPGPFCNAPSGAFWAGLGQAAHGGGGGPSKRYLGPDPHLGGFDPVGFLCRGVSAGFLIFLMSFFSAGLGGSEWSIRAIRAAFFRPKNCKIDSGSQFLPFSGPSRQKKQTQKL